MRIIKLKLLLMVPILLSGCANNQNQEDALTTITPSSSFSYVSNSLSDENQIKNNVVEYFTKYSLCEYEIGKLTFDGNSHENWSDESQQLKELLNTISSSEYRDITTTIMQMKVILKREVMPDYMTENTGNIKVTFNEINFTDNDTASVDVFVEDRNHGYARSIILTHYTNNWLIDNISFDEDDIYAQLERDYKRIRESISDKEMDNQAINKKVIKEYTEECKEAFIQQNKLNN